MAARVLPLVGLSLGVSASSVSPVEQVVTLLTDLKAEVEQEGKDEAGTYDKFACFCKDTTKTKAEAITGGRDTIEGLSATIEEDAAKKVEDQTELGKRKKKQEELAGEVDTNQVRCQKEQAEFEVVIADLTKAVGSLDKAITALKGSKSAFLQRDALKEVSETLGIAELLGLVQEHSQMSLPAVLAQLQKVDPEDPAYKFHSSGIISTLEKMKTDFAKKLSDETTEKEKAKTACTKMITALESEMTTNDDAMGGLKTDIGAAEKKIAQDRGSLIQAQGTLEDDQSYIKDLTERCETSAREWDQRSSIRADEVKALGEALAILVDGKDGQKSVQDLDAVNNRSFVQKKQVVRPGAVNARVLSLLQTATSQQVVRAHARTTECDQVADFIRQEGIKLKSQMLTALSSKLNKEPFAEVKGLIQKLIQRLLDEATQEATKKGFCDMELGKAKKDRDFRFEDISKLSAELTVLDAKKDELNLTIDELKDKIPGLYDTLNETTTQRADEKKDNLKAIQTAKEGVQAIKEAIDILRVFYSGASKGRVDLLQASPVDEDTEGAGFSGAYKGKQSSSEGIIGLLETIHGDFDRTVRQTKQGEKEAREEYVKFERTSKEDISAKEMTLELNTQELEVTENRIKKKIGDLETAQRLLDDALKTIENLKPMCFDTGMTAAERASAREEEIAALKQALTILAAPP